MTPLIESEILHRRHVLQFDFKKYDFHYFTNIGHQNLNPNPGPEFTKQAGVESGFNEYEYKSPLLSKARTGCNQTSSFTVQWTEI